MVPVVVAVCLPEEAVTTYPEIGEPPVSVGAVQVTTARPSPAVALTVVGAPGTVAGVIAVEAVEASEVPVTVVATTVNV